MWLWLVVVAQVIIDTILHVYFFGHCLVPRKSFFVGKILPFISFVCAELIFFQMEQSVWRPFLSVALCIIIVSVCYSDKFTVKLFTALAEIAIMLTIEMVCYILLAVALGNSAINVYELMSFDPLVVIIRFLYQTIFWPAIYLYVHVWVRRKIRKNYGDFLAFAITLFVHVGLVIAVLRSFFDYFDHNAVALMLMAVFAGIISDIIMVTKLEESSNRNILSEQLTHVEAIRNMEFRYYCRLKDEIQTIRNIRHDALNHIQSIEYLMQGTKGQMHYAYEMAEEFKSSLMLPSHNNLYCQNDMVDYVLSELMDTVENKELYEIRIDACQNKNEPWMNICILIITGIVEFTRENALRLSHIKIHGSLARARLELTAELQMCVGKSKLKHMNETVESLENIMEENGGRLWTDYLKDEKKYVWYIYG